MSSLRLEALNEKLLRAGIAPRHVRRYLNELRQHFDDLLRAETASGLSGEAAFAAARARLGSDDALAAAMICRPELRALGVRYPWAVFGLAPMLVLGLLIVAAVLMEAGLLKIAHPEGSSWPAGLKSVITTWDWAMTYLLPIIVSVAVFCLGARQLIKMRWVAVGALLSAAIGAEVTLTTKFSSLPHQSAISVSWALGSLSIDDGTLLRTTVNLGLVAAMSTLYWLWRRNRAVIAD